VSLDEYVDFQQRNFEAIKDTLHYSGLVVTVDRLYRSTLALGHEHCPRVCFGEMLLMCHKSFLSAATLIARGQSDDAPPITRRAIEIGQLAVAVYLDPKNYEAWLDQERRADRTKARMQGERPKNEPAHKWGKEILEHPLLSDLRTFLGMVSDYYAHFTPEFQGNLAWSKEVKPGENATIRLAYFDTTKSIIDAAFINLATIHLKLLDVFNACFNDALEKDGGWRMLRTTAFEIGRDLARQLKVESEAADKGRTG
jgi:hypothetical protein